ncbi:MAG: hypothetical protein SGARI_002068 [Bacillariaceae sp.]
MDAVLHLMVATVFFTSGYPGCERPAGLIEVVLGDDEKNVLAADDVCNMLAQVYGMMRVVVGLFEIFAAGKLHSWQRMVVCLGLSGYHAASTAFVLRGGAGEDDKEASAQVHGFMAALMLVGVSLDLVGLASGGNGNGKHSKEE